MRRCEHAVMSDLEALRRFLHATKPIQRVPVPVVRLPIPRIGRLPLREGRDSGRTSAAHPSGVNSAAQRERVREISGNEYSSVLFKRKILLVEAQLVALLGPFET